MSVRPIAVAKNSTTGRAVKWSRAAAMRALAAAAPGFADALVYDLFGTPQRSAWPPPEAPGLETHTFRHDELAVHDWGAGRTVLLVHGWNGASAQLSPFVEPLVRAGYYVAALDLPAHGASGGRHTTVAGFADAISRVGRRLGPVHAVVAHSLGAAGAIWALADGLQAERAVLLAPAVNLPRFPRGFARFLGYSPAQADRFVAYLGRRVGRPDFDLRKLAPLMRPRLLVLHDPADREVPVEDGKDLAAAWPGGLFEAIPGAGHTRLLRNADVVRKTIQFVTESTAPVSLTA